MAKPNHDTNDASHLKSVGGPARILNAIRYSLSGLRYALRHEAAFRQECIVVIPALIACWFLQITTVEKLLLFGSALAVLVIEILNSAIEAAIDRISTERHPLSGRAKDLGSAAVMLTLCFAGFCWLMIAGPIFLQWIKQ
jgi:diacylglycerol kinase (ATP)